MQAALLKDESFSGLKTEPSKQTRQIAEQLLAWIPANKIKAFQFELKLLVNFCVSCLQSTAKSQKKCRENMWRSYHTLRTSSGYIDDWNAFLSESGTDTSKSSSIFYQFVGNYIFKEVIKRHYPIAITNTCTSDQTNHQPLTYEETNGLLYAAGYIPRQLRKKLPKSLHPLRNYILMCIGDCLMTVTMMKTRMTHMINWVELVNRGRLTRVNNTTFDMFMTMELELRHACFTDTARTRFRANCHCN